MINHFLRIFYRIFPKYRFITFDEADNMINKLILDIKKDKFYPDIIIGILNGGLYPSKKIAKSLKKKNIFLGVNHYSIKLFGKEIEYFPFIKRLLYILGYKEKVRLVKGIDIKLKSKKILIVDDECGTGSTLKVAKNYLETKGAKPIKTAVLINYKENKEVDYWGKSSPKKLCMMPWVEISPYYNKNFFK